MAPESPQKQLAVWPTHRSGVPRPCRACAASEPQPVPTWHAASAAHGSSPNSPSLWGLRQYRGVMAQLSDGVALCLRTCADRKREWGSGGFLPRPHRHAVRRRPAPAAARAASFLVASHRRCLRKARPSTDFRWFVADAQVPASRSIRAPNPCHRSIEGLAATSAGDGFTAAPNLIISGDRVRLHRRRRVPWVCRKGRSVRISGTSPPSSQSL